jgi:branched-chain amino acid transport system permease protein
MSTFLPLLVTGVTLGSVLAVLSLGFAISYWPSRHFHFAYGSVFICATYAIWYVAADRGWPLAIGIVAGGGVAVVVGLACYFVFYRPLRDEQTIFLTSFALSILVQNVLQILFSANPQAIQLPHFLAGRAFSLSATAPVTVFALAEIVICLGIWALVELFLRRSRAGTGLRALSSDPFLTECVGIESRRLTALAYVIGSLLATVGAVFFALDYGLTPDAGTTPLFYAINAVLIGGTFSMTGAGLGGLLLGLVVNLGIWHLPSAWQTSIAFAVLFIILVVRPQGLLARAGT